MENRQHGAGKIQAFKRKLSEFNEVFHGEYGHARLVEKAKTQLVRNEYFDINVQDFVVKKENETKSEYYNRVKEAGAAASRYINAAD
ncbi:MAG: hypothetical protein V4490_06775, partial [Pseudomonadota bacterium]